MKIPCKDCLLLGVCKHKDYRQLLTDCRKLFDVLYRGSNFEQRVLKVGDFSKAIHDLETLFNRENYLLSSDL